MPVQPMGFGRGRAKGAATKTNDLFKNVDTTPGAAAAPAPAASWGVGGGSSQSNGGGYNGGASYGGGGNSFGGRGGGDGCRNCGEDGHFARECPTKQSGSETCRSCGQVGHYSRECPSRQPSTRGGGEGGDGCRVCGESGHWARECPSKGEEKCFRCQQTGHRVADCTEEDTRDPNAPAAVTYIPVYDDSEDALFSNTKLNTGINFKKYRDIPVKVTGPGHEMIKCVEKFEQLQLGQQLQRNIARSGYVEPTPVQKWALPMIMSGNDVMACAQTGSGKTAAFVLPMINVINTQGVSSSEFSQTQTPDAMVITPTRELAIQIERETKKFASSTLVKVQLAYGGVSVQSQRSNIRRGCNILVGTPGRLKQFVNDGTISLVNIKFFVLDEADRMLDMGFKEDIEFFARSGGMPAKDKRQTLLFSATFAEEVQQIAKYFLKTEYLFLAVGTVGAAQSDVTQIIHEVEYSQKIGQLKDVIRGLGPKYKALVFVKTKKSADFLATLLSQEDFGATSIHGDRQQREREEALRDFRTGSHPILVATSVAARGLDIPGVTHVINYDMPDEIDEYVHRIGRTGRAGNTGTSISFFETDKDCDMARNLVKVLSGAQQDVPSWLDDLSSGAGAAGTGGWNSRGGQFGGHDTRDSNYNSGGNSNNAGWNSNAGPDEDELW